MTYDPTDPNDPNDPNRLRTMDGPYTPTRRGPHWGWIAGVFAVIILGLIFFAGNSGDGTRTATNNPGPATTGSAPPGPPPSPTTPSPAR